MKRHKPEELIHHYANDIASEEERIIVESWHIHELKKSDYLPSKDQITIVHKRMWDRLVSHTSDQVDNTIRKKLWPRITATAAILILFSAIWLIYINPISTAPEVVLTRNDVAPAVNKATLTLSNGVSITLVQSSKKLIVTKGGIKIQKSDGLLVYNQDNSSSTAIVSNKLETPRGGKYRVFLPDGTKVWLNSASTLTYPSTFKGNERRVNLDGEAYFEVAKDKKKKFKVITKGQTIEVLGTHFNVRSYNDENLLKTTLAEGKVKISNALDYKVLKPGQAAFTDEHSKRIQIADANLEKDLSWKNNEFIFEGEDLLSIMKEVSRWYDVEPIYVGDFSKDKYFGVVSRSKNISEVLKMLQLTGKISFKIEGRRITFMN